MTRVAAGALVVTAAIALTFIGGCGGAPQAPAPASGLATPSSSVGPSASSAVPSAAPAEPSGTPSAAAVEARKLMESADFADPDSIDEIGASLRFTLAGEEAARAILESPGSDAMALWTALWVYGSAGTDAGPVRPLLAHDDPSLRAMAAAILVSLGDDSGFAVVREALATDALLTGSEPPISIRQYAVNTVTRYVTGSDVPQPPDEIPDEDDGSAAAEAWEQWLAANGEGLVFDQPSATWAVP